MDTLVLAHTCLPLGRVSWQDAISMVLTGRVEVLEEYEGCYIHSATEVFPVPSVVRFIRVVKDVYQKVFGRSIKFNRKNVWLRDKGICQYCRTKVALSEFTFDHVTPRKQGGKTQWENIVVACPSCNQRKRDRTPDQAGMKLRVKPLRPKSLKGMAFPAFTWTDRMPESWKDYVGSYVYWNQSFLPE